MRGVVDEHQDRVARLDEVFDLDAPLGPCRAPVFDPALPAGVPDVIALVRRLVIADLQGLGEVVPDRLAGSLKMLEAAPDDLDVRLRHRDEYPADEGEGVLVRLCITLGG